MGLRTPLYDAHQQAGARLVPFGGWDMPLHYGSQLTEHHAVRRDAGVFDVSHMRPVDLSGSDATGFLRHLLANDVARLATDGQALYSCMLNPSGGVIDDLICYRLGDGRYRLVVNAATADKDIAWMQAQVAGRAVTIERRDDLAMLAIQGPNARARATLLLPLSLQAPVGALAPFHATGCDDWVVGRTGYTGEDGLEVMLPAVAAPAFWASLIDAGVAPCGLGARDTLRLEAGMNLYGQDMDEDTDPLISGLGWTVAWDSPGALADAGAGASTEVRDFIGRAALTPLRNMTQRPRLVGLLLTGRGVLRAHQRVLLDDQPVGTITSGGFAPTLERSIALARVSAALGRQPGAVCAVDIRGQAVPAQIVKPPFVRHGKPLIAV